MGTLDPDVTVQALVAIGMRLGATGVDSGTGDNENAATREEHRAGLARSTPD